ncbi:MAG TPA: hypothetical protein VEA69_06065 [Tepidisphaeraceae bacterium]|nr:hypothetical protein [Tepidisphaeraceae bacterium]
MRIPKGLLSVGAVAAKDVGNRYQMHGVMVRRKGDKIEVAATNGKSALVVEAPDAVSSPLPGFEDAEKRIENFKTILPAQVAIRADKAAPKSKRGKSPQPLEGVLLNEATANGTVELVAYDHFAALTQTTRVGAINTTFPPIEQVIPSHEIVKDEAPPAGGKPTPLRAVRVRLNPRLLSELMAAMASAVPDPDDQRGVTLEVPLVPNRPVKLERKCGDRKATGVLMPLVAVDD